MERGNLHKKHPIQFKLDTGAEVTVISETAFANIKNTQLQRASRILLGPARQKLEVLGQFDGHFLCKGETCQQVAFVMKGLKTNLLGLPTIVALKLLGMINQCGKFSPNLAKLMKPLRGLLTKNSKCDRPQENRPQENRPSSHLVMIVEIPILKILIGVTSFCSCLADYLL